MNILDTRIYRWAQAATDFFLLNLLWLLACLPVVTAFPATAAMFGVVRDWVRGKETGVFATFVQRFRQNFVQSLVVGVLWTLFGGALFLDFLLANQLSGGAQVVMRSLLVLATVLYAFASVFLFPVMVHYETRWTAVPKNALLLSVGRLPTTLICLVTVAAAATLTFIVPFLLVVTPSATAYAIYRLCDREFRRIDGL
ncbi:DUF624 domain-containing protein [Rubrobacter tropicus]|uniref:DUF624 domain-containing protein n=1 Tax=Rubrobacter tropicus TaxID=2653851 RepID=A0A6G8QAK3_9ACTN|nr:DUF624 domain-containing protein [Rubrobacter tropicus]QIN83489.1 DUF624 domain-containing protein [Rubrobacter tropicus]